MLHFLRIFVIVAYIHNASCTDKSAKMSKLLKRIDEDKVKKKEYEEVFDTKYLKFIDDDQKVLSDFTGSVERMGANERCPKGVHQLPKEMRENCKKLDPEEFKQEPSILVALHNGRLGNQMSSFATIYSLAQMAGGAVRIGLTNVQYLFLSEMFPYFEDHYQDHVLESIYCNDMCNEMKWKAIVPNAHEKPMEAFLVAAKRMNNSLSLGQGLNLGSYVNIPMVYKPYLPEMRQKFFVFKEEFQSKAKEIMENFKTMLPEEPDAVIGIHGRFTDYRGHLKHRGLHVAANNYFDKAINHFRNIYKRPLFLVVSDNPRTAKTHILKNQEFHKDIFIAGTIEQAVEGELSLVESKGIDFALLTQCDHVIASHGTFGMWAIFLANPNNTHIMAHDLRKDDQMRSVSSDDSPFSHSFRKMEDLEAMKKADFENIIYMDDN